MILFKRLVLPRAARPLRQLSRLIAIGGVPALSAAIAGLYMLTLKGVRIALYPMALGVAGVGAAAASDLFVAVALVVLAVATRGAWRNERRRARVWGGAAVALISLETILHAYWVGAREGLDATVAMYALDHWNEIGPVLASGASAGPWLMGGIAVLTVVLAPTLARLLGAPVAMAAAGPAATPCEPPMASAVAGATPSSASHRAARPTRGRPVWLGVAALGLAAAALLPSVTGVDRRFTREPILSFVASAVTYAADAIASDDVGARENPALRLTLQPRTVAGATEGQPAGRRMNLVIVLLESVGAGATSLYSPGLDTTPFLAELAQKSLVADRAYAVVPHTSKALVAALCGIEPNFTFSISETRRQGIPGRCLAELLSGEGYRTAFFQSAVADYEGRAKLVANMGFGEFISVDQMPTAGFERANYFGYEDAIMLGPSAAYLAKHKDEPLFAAYLANTPHHQYLAPRQRYGFVELVPEPEHNRYLNSVRYVDGFVRELIEQYRGAGLLDRTLFVIVGDHGEAFGEHGLIHHDDIPYDEVMRVPLLFYDPRHPDPRRLSLPASELDIAPTALDLLGLDIVQGSLPGQSLLAAAPGRVAMSACYREGRCLVRVADGSKYVHYFGARADELFDLTRDPAERRSLSATCDSRCAAWKAELLAWYEAVRARHRAVLAGELARYVGNERPVVANPQNAALGAYATLIGYRLSAAAAHRGDSVRVTLYFEVHERLPEGYRLFMHGNAPPREFKNLDHVPAAGLYPLEAWRPSQFVIDEYTLKVPRNWKADTMELSVGFWHPRRGRVVLDRVIDPDGDNRYLFARLAIQR